MRKFLSLFFCALLLLSITIISWKPVYKNKQNKNSKPLFTARELLEKYIDNIYASAHLQVSGMDFGVFEKGVIGFINLKRARKVPQNSAILTVIDYSLPSCEKRMWIIDVINKQLILNTLVAHGQGSGEDMANHFSDKIDSHASSLGFYLTDDVYYGKNGRSLHLEGLDEGFNIHARKREIVVHGADYVSESTIGQIGYLGRSFGCPAVSQEVAEQVINTIKEKTVMFISGNSDRYNSKYLDKNLAADYFSSEFTDVVFAGL